LKDKLNKASLKAGIYQSEYIMLRKLKAFAITLGLIIITWFVGRTTYRYFTFNQPPIVAMVKLEQEGTYNKDLHCAITANNNYKISYIRAFLDNKEIDLGCASSVRTKQFEVPLNIDTTHLADGKHTLDIEATDASYHHNASRKQWTFYVDNKPLRATFVEPNYKVDQGKTLHLKVQANKKLRSVSLQFLSKTYECSLINDLATTYECFIPIECEENPQEILVTANIEDLVKNTMIITTNVQITAFPFKKQKGFSISQEKLQEETEVSSSSKVLEDALAKWVKESPKKKLWHGPFDTPVEVQRITTPFGEMRVIPERGRHMHKGIDIINRPHCSVWASQTGKVIIKDRFYLTGNTVVLDHGLGVFTLYGHLEDFANIQVGDIIKKGLPVGKLGMTGYATGYHLHWEVRINNIPVDPLEWTTTVY
jgi:murein DD-endopeptidase MepM/ murein hydrolase activator NlpD